MFSICYEFSQAALRHSHISHHTNRPTATLRAYSFSPCQLHPSIHSPVVSEYGVSPVELRNALVHTQHCSPPSPHTRTLITGIKGNPTALYV